MIFYSSMILVDNMNFKTMIAGRGCGNILMITPCCSFDDLDVALSECLLNPKCIGVWKEVENNSRIAYLLCRTVNLQYERPTNHKLFLKGKILYFAHNLLKHSLYRKNSVKNYDIYFYSATLVTGSTLTQNATTTNKIISTVNNAQTTGQPTTHSSIDSATYPSMRLSTISRTTNSSKNISTTVLSKKVFNTFQNKLKDVILLEIKIFIKKFQVQQIHTLRPYPILEICQHQQ